MNGAIHRINKVIVSLAPLLMLCDGPQLILVKFARRKEILKNSGPRPRKTETKSYLLLCKGIFITITFGFDLLLDYIVAVTG